MGTTSRAVHESQREFSENLKMLCSYYRSVADVCRKLNINRAQFNRYLNGSSKPSSHTLERICEFFGVEAFEIYLPREHFHQIVQARPRERAEGVKPALHANHIARLQRQTGDKFDKYLGYYYEYYYSLSAPDRILRGLVHIFSHEGGIYHERLERFPQRATLDGTYRCKYVGSSFYLNDRIFLVDYESLTGNEISQTILFPTYKHKVSRLSGLLLGVSATNRRSIACARVVFEFLGKTIDLRRAIRNCGLYDPQTGEIDAAILRAINNAPHAERDHFYTISL